MKSLNTDKENKNISQRTRKKRKKISESYLYNSGLYYLERFPASVSHFKFVMKRKIERSFEDHPEQSKDDINAWLDVVVQRFIELGYLNDKLYARGVVNSLRRKGTSSTKIIMTLKQKGVDSDIAAEVLNEIDADNKVRDDIQYNPDLNAAITYCRRKRMSAADYHLETMDYDEKMKLKNKYLGRLARQGFSYDVSVKALDALVDLGKN
jgi:regulatory protein